MIIYLELIDNERDRNKFIQIYKLYSQQMFSVAYARVNNDQDAEDAVHQAFLEIMENLNKVRQIDSPETKALVCLIAERRAIDIYRAGKRFANAHLADYSSYLAVETDPEDKLTSAIERLNPRYREILLLRYKMGYSIKELSKMSGHKKDTLQKLLYRAKQALKKELEMEDNDDE